MELSIDVSFHVFTVVFYKSHAACCKFQYGVSHQVERGVVDRIYQHVLRCARGNAGRGGSSEQVCQVGCLLRRERSALQRCGWLCRRGPRLLVRMLGQAWRFLRWRRFRCSRWRQAGTGGARHVDPRSRCRTFKQSRPARRRIAAPRQRSACGFGPPLRMPESWFQSMSMRTGW